MNDKPSQTPQPARPKMPFRALLLWMLLLSALALGYRYMASPQDASRELAYSDFLTLVRQDGIAGELTLSMGSDGTRIRGVRKDDQSEFTTQAIVTDGLLATLDASKVAYAFKTENPLFWNLVGAVLPILLLFGLFYFFFYRNMGAQRGALTFGKSRARLMGEEGAKITFKDVAGVDEAKDEVQEIVAFLKDPKKFQRLGGRIPKGVLLVGPPGTGKTLLAKAIAGEAGVPFFSISGSDFVEMFVGVGASRVRDMFEQGKKSAPCIIFIDEIDAVGRSRFSGIGGGHDEREQTLNALLVEMDGFDAQEGIIIIAATNRPDVLDPALLRPGRFDRQITVDLPTLEGRIAILKIHTRKVKLAEDASLRDIARGTPGFSGADLANLVNEAALGAARRDAEAVGAKDLEEARDKVLWGRERKSRKMDEKDRKLTAYHEAGHALCLALSEGTEPLHKVTIIPRGQALGATFQLPEKDRVSMTRKQLLGSLVGTMGGRAAEKIVFGDGEVTTGASQDIKQATHTARMMVTAWGMSDLLGPQYFGNREELLFLGREVSRSNEISQETAKLIDDEVKKIIDDAYAKALSLLQREKDKLVLLAETLLERETLSRKEIDQLLNHGRLLTAAEEKAEETDKTAEPETPAAADGPALPVASSPIAPPPPPPAAG